MGEPSPNSEDDPLCGVFNWIDERFGPIRRLSASRLGSPEPEWWVYTCDLARAPAGTWYTPYPAGAAGTSIEPGEALQRVLGEAVERYSALDAAVNGFPLAPLESPLIHRFPLCAPEEPCLPSFRGLDPDLPITHVRVRRLATDDEVVVPAAHVHLSFQPGPNEPLPAPPISSGLAFHPVLHEAIWNGLCEVAERDAIMVMWWNRRSVRAIDLADTSVPDALISRLERLDRAGLATHLFDITTDFRLPTVFCLLQAESPPYWTAGAA